MDSRKRIMTQTGQILLGLVLCMAPVVGVYALLGAYELKVLLGAIAGTVLATANFFAMAFAADAAADRAQAQDVAGGQKIVTLSYTVRMVVLFGALAICAISGWFHVVTLVIPLALVRPILTVIELFSRKGGGKA